MRHFSIAALLSLAVLAFAHPTASAHDEDWRPQRCREEIDEVCPGYGSGKNPGCLQQHRGQLSLECRELAKHPLPRRCLIDAKAFCAGKPGDGQFNQCVRQNFYQLSRTCQEQLFHWYTISGEWKSKAQEACADDGDICPGISHGFGKWWFCLEKNEARLSSSCKFFMTTDKETD